ncbi:MAG: uroporphyrinogen decarboxylase family protein [Bilifractor sp.]|nr:hypothetical protein [Lachnospiraceae bacterium]MDY2837272.1 uroporphyrinogen decarboxylase family protein [Bilifractor sp.]
MNEQTKKIYQEKLDRVNNAIQLKPTDRVPIAPFFSSYAQRSEGSSYRDLYYDFDKAGEAAVRFYRKHPMLDAYAGISFTSGKANELANSQMIDWPGRPGTKVSDYSSHQVIEREFMTQDEYPEMLSDFTGFMIRKYIPRAFPNLRGLSGIQAIPTIVLSTSILSPFYSPAALEAYSTLGKIAEADAEAAAASQKYGPKIADLGLPVMFTGASEAPYDILGDYFRGTMGIFEDLIDEDIQEYMEQACDLFADQQIQALQYFRYADLPVKRVFFPLHKAMDGFMNDEQFERLYWKPLKKIMLALIDMDVTPFIYCEGKYSSRLEHLADVPKGKVLYHFEKVDMKEAKRILGGTACISGNLPISQLEFGKKETVIDMTRQLLEDCMPDGGYIFDFDGCLENAKEENLDAMFETLEKYGKY